MFDPTNENFVSKNTARFSMLIMMRINLTGALDTMIDIHPNERKVLEEEIARLDKRIKTAEKKL